MHPQRDIRNVLFDLDGTLIDHLPAIHASYAHALPQVGIAAPTIDQVRRAIGGGLENAMSKFVPPEKMETALRIYRAYWDANLPRGASLQPGALELLRHLAENKIRCAVLTNKHGPSSRQICEHLGIAHFFETILGAKDTPWIKPQIEFTQTALEKLRADPAKTALVGDSPWDIEAAQNAGLFSLVVTTGSHTREQLIPHHPTAIHDNLAQLHAAEFP